jgi:hypothetical protein
VVALNDLIENPNRDDYIQQLLKFKGWTSEMLEELIDNKNTAVLIGIIENKAATKNQIAEVLSQNYIPLDRATTRRALEKHFSLYELLDLPIVPSELLQIQSVANFVKDNLSEGGTAEAFLANLVGEKSITMGSLLNLAKLATSN